MDKRVLNLMIIGVPLGLIIANVISQEPVYLKGIVPSNNTLTSSSEIQLADARKLNGELVTQIKKDLSAIIVSKLGILGSGSDYQVQEQVEKWFDREVAPELSYSYGDAEVLGVSSLRRLKYYLEINSSPSWDATIKSLSGEVVSGFRSISSPLNKFIVGHDKINEPDNSRLYMHVVFKYSMLSYRN